MDFLTRLWSGIQAFREAYMVSSVQNTDDWTDQDARSLRYAVNWAQYEGTSYRDVHAWATAYRKQYGMYKYARPIYNPAFRLGEFYKTHLFGGLLDPDAMDSGAIPIITDNKDLYPAIADLWKWSRWQVNKDILSVRGAIMGDVGIRIVDDVERKHVYMEIFYPGALHSVDKDPFGNVKGYVIREQREDPENTSRDATYVEEVIRDGEYVVYRTYRNGAPYAWPGNQGLTSWAEPYGFVPLVLIQHNDVGLEWGWSEFHPTRSKVQEADDLAAQISDQIRKYIDPVWLMKGMRSTSLEIEGASDTADSDRPFPGREEIQAVWGVDPDAEAVPMVAPLDMSQAIAHLHEILAEIERDMPELGQSLQTASGDASGRALRVARQPIVSKVLQRRVNYDAGLVAAQQMAISIGGWRGYYPGFNLDSYANGDLDHEVGDRPVFENDPLDEIEISAEFWGAASKAIAAGVDLRGYLADSGWEEERIEKLNIQGESDEITEPSGNEVL